MNPYAEIKDQGRSAGASHARYEDSIIDRIAAQEASGKSRVLRELGDGADDLRVMYCNSCVTRVIIKPTVDCGYCGTCGYRLEPFGPFAPKPSLFPEPKPLPRVWWIGNKPADAL